MTGLFNRATCEKLVEEHLATAKSSIIGTMLLIDIDYFKDFNGKFRNDIGDFVLKLIGNTMQEIFRFDNIVSRWGGDEFVVSMLDICDKRTVASRIERLRVRLYQ